MKYQYIYIFTYIKNKQNKKNFYLSAYLFKHIITYAKTYLYIYQTEAHKNNTKWLYKYRFIL